MLSRGAESGGGELDEGGLESVDGDGGLLIEVNSDDRRKLTLGIGLNDLGRTEKSILGAPYSCTITESRLISPGEAAMLAATSLWTITTIEWGRGRPDMNFLMIGVAA